MTYYSDGFDHRRQRNAQGLAAFGANVNTAVSSNPVRTVRQGGSTVLYTVGYEKRDGEGMMAALIDQGIKVLADVRERPMSRKPDFRAKALRQLCLEAGIEYQPWPKLGSTADQRDRLKETGDFPSFAEEFHDYARQNLSSELRKLGKNAQCGPTALMCYERLHEECHRSVIADMVATQIDATIVAIL